MSGYLRNCLLLLALSLITVPLVAATWNPATDDAPISPRLSAVLSPLLFLSSKTPYHYEQQLSPLVDDHKKCRVIHINHLGRHGSRHGTKLDSALRLKGILQAALQATDCEDTVATSVNGETPTCSRLTELGTQLIGWVSDYLARESGVLGKLTALGASEARNQSIRLVERLRPHILLSLAQGRRAVLADTTFKPRVAATRDAFLEGLHLALAENASMLYIYKKDSESLPCTPDGKRSDAVSSAVKEYSKLRFFDTCTAYLRYKQSKPWANQVTRFLVNATRYRSHEDLFLSQVFTADFRWQLASEGVSYLEEELLSSVDGPIRDSKKVVLQSKDKDKDKDKGKSKSKDTQRKQKTLHTASVVSDIYELCQVEASAHRIFDRFCSLFSGKSAASRKSHYLLMRKQELVHDLADYYKKGAGSPYAYSMSCLLLEDVLQAAELAIEKPNDAPLMNLRFAHAETVIPFIAFLRLYTDDEKHLTAHGTMGFEALPVFERWYIDPLDRGTSHLLDDITMPADTTTNITAGSTTDAQREVEFLSSLLPALKPTVAGSRLSPMAANVVLELLDCGQSTFSHDKSSSGQSKQQHHRYWIRLLHNEKPVQFPPCDPTRNGGSVFNGGPLQACPFSVVANYYRKKVYDDLGVGSCSAKDWGDLCGGANVPTCEDINAADSTDATE